jgi:DNA-binding response OmpR family regulator
MKIMVVDDDPAICNMLKIMLSARGHQVDTYLDPTATPIVQGQEEAAIKESCSVDVMLVDYCMPNMNGLDFLKLANERDCGTKKCKKAIITAYGTAEVCRELNQLGIKYFRKPFRFPEINNWLEECSLSVAEAR